MNTEQLAHRIERELIERSDHALSLITHDLKSPLVAIMGFTGLLRRGIEKQPHNQEWLAILRRMESAGESMMRLIEDLLFMAKAEAGREPLEPSWVEGLEAELADIVSAFQLEAGARRIALSLDTRGPLPRARWDMRRLRYHAINNVISNALKFTPEEGMVTVQAKAEGEKIALRVVDNGPGIPPSERGRIFQRFERAASSSARVAKGCGLGLYNASLVVTRHGGEIFIEDTPDGAGACVCLRLPCEPAVFPENLRLV